MLGSITATGVIAAATSWGSSISAILMIVIGFGVLLVLANWAIAKFRGRAGGGKRRK